MSSLQLSCLLGIRCNDFVMLVADQTNQQSVVIMRNDEDKIFPMAEHIAAAVGGDGGDSAQLAQYVHKNLQLYRMRNQYGLDTHAAVHFTRRTLAEALRNRTPYSLNLLLGGFEPAQGGQLYYLDHLASSMQVPFAAHGLGGLICFGTLDRSLTNSSDLRVEEAYTLAKLCIQEVQLRLIVNLPNFQVTVVDRCGVRNMPAIKASEL